MSKEDFYSKEDIFGKKIAKVLVENSEVSDYVSRRLEAARHIALSNYSAKGSEKSLFALFVEKLSFKVVAPAILAAGACGFVVLVQQENESIYKSNQSLVMNHYQKATERSVEFDQELINLLKDEV